MIVLDKSGGARMTVNHKNINDITSRLSQLPISRVDHALDSLGKGRVFSLFALVS